MADIDSAAQMMYNFSEEQGIVMSEEASYQEFVQRPLWSAADNEEYFVENDSGTSKNLRYYDDICRFHAFSGKDYSGTKRCDGRRRLVFRYDSECYTVSRICCQENRDSYVLLKRKKGYGVGVLRRTVLCAPTLLYSKRKDRLNGREKEKF